VSPSRVEVQLHYNAPLPGSTAGTGDGSLKMTLPGQGELTLRLPYVIGQGTTLGATEVKLGYDLAPQHYGLPNVAVAAFVDLPTATGMRGPEAGVKTSAVKQLGSGFFENLHLQGELRTEGPNLDPSYRIAAGTMLRLGPRTSGSLDLIDQGGSPLGGANSTPGSPVGQLGVKHKLNESTGLRLDLMRNLGDAGALRATIGIDRHF
jgi:hypothetical protein